MRDLSETIQAEFPTKKIVVVGDLVADQFLRGTIARVSREAPVFILRHNETETLAGSAANAAVNVAALGGKAVLVGLVGRDANGAALLEKLENSKVECGFITKSENFQTTTKLRVLAGQHYAARQQVIRIDYENKTTIDAKVRQRLRENFLAASQNADAIIISDYSYGVASLEFTKIIVKTAKGKNIPALVDSRFRLEDFPNATAATPNQDEVEQILGKNFSDDDCARLRGKLGYEFLLVTRGNQGMLLVEKDKNPVSIEAVGAKEPVDVTGAGDTVIAAFALGLASGLSFAESARLANHAGGIVVMKKGTAAASADELIDSLQKAEATESKAQTL
ncbi:MAG: bifunctional heptose 7-phosphate kinase/heptose 1-phosphate adenyltransferase [Pyrinomonadaceae bacterium]